MKLQINVAIQIQQPIEKVYEAIINPVHMTNYFIGRSTGIMEANRHLIWHFPEFEGEVPIRVGQLITYEMVEFFWIVGEDEHTVQIKLVSRPDGSTVVYITESESENDEKGLQWLKGNTEGWANFAACLKAYLDHGINLREGEFGFRFDKQGCI